MFINDNSLLDGNVCMFAGNVSFDCADNSVITLSFPNLYVRDTRLVVTDSNL